MKTKILAFLVTPIFIFISCNLQTTDEFDEIEVTEKAARLIEANNDFGFEMFGHVYSEEKSAENIMVSPLSVSLALAMTYNGAKNETKTAIEKALKVYGLSPADINTSYFDLVNALKSLDQKVLLEIANAIYYRKNFEVENSFIKTNQQYYNAEISSLDFSSPNALKIINGWVAEKTHNKIETILDEIKPSQVMFLLNAIYFKGIWTKEFNKKSTEQKPFYLEDGSTIQTETMQRTDTLPYTSNALFSAIQLSYGKGNYNMYVFLPEYKKNLKDIIDQLNSDNWQTWMKSFSLTQNVDIKFPKLKYEYEIKLNDILTEMGMGVAFTGAADFTGINRDGGLYIDYVKHKTFIDVNEEGTEAAAVTIVAIDKTSVGPQKIAFYLNRPFIYAITEKSTGAILFMGTVTNPSKS